jgi:hypothetical protein
MTWFQYIDSLEQVIELPAGIGALRVLGMTERSGERGRCQKQIGPGWDHYYYGTVNVSVNMADLK